MATTDCGPNNSCVKTLLCTCEQFSVVQLQVSCLVLTRLASVASGSHLPYWLLAVSWWPQAYHAVFQGVSDTAAELLW
jgi:hypothetical protein